MACILGDIIGMPQPRIHEIINRACGSWLAEAAAGRSAYAPRPRSADRLPAVGHPAGRVGELSDACMGRFCRLYYG